MHPHTVSELFSAVLISPSTAAETVVAACTCAEGAAACPPRYWRLFVWLSKALSVPRNGYLGADRSALLEFWSPWPARARLVESMPSEAPGVRVGVWGARTTGRRSWQSGCGTRASRSWPLLGSSCHSKRGATSDVEPLSPRASSTTSGRSSSWSTGGKSIGASAPGRSTWRRPLAARRRRPMYS